MPDETTGRRWDSADRSRERHLGDITEEQQRFFDSGAMHQRAKEESRDDIRNLEKRNRASAEFLEKYKMLSDKVEDAYEHGIIGAQEAKRRLKSLTHKYKQSEDRGWWQDNSDDNVPDPREALILREEVIHGTNQIESTGDFYDHLDKQRAWRIEFAYMNNSLPGLEQFMDTDKFREIEEDVNSLGAEIEAEDDYFREVLDAVLNEIGEREDRASEFDMELDNDQADLKEVILAYLVSHPADEDKMRFINTDKDKMRFIDVMRFNPAKRRIMPPAPRNPRLEDVVQSSLRKPVRNQGARANRAALSFSPANYRIRL